MIAARGDTPQARDALERLCQAYWFPLYAYLRRQGNPPADAADLTQGFFATLLRRRDLERVDPTRGRFRSFLLAGVKHFAINEHARAAAQKRGGGQQLLSLDFDAAEGRFAAEAAEQETPESLFDKQWALTLLERATTALRRDYETSGQAELFRALHPRMAGDGDVGYRQLSEALQMTEAALKSAMHRLRRRFRVFLREEIAQTVASPDEIDGEVSELFEVLRR